MTRDAAPPPGAADASAPPAWRRAVRIGITGPIGCGKSTVAGWLRTRGAVGVDADVEARAVTAPGEPAHAAILAQFGDAVRGTDGVLDRAALARLVFADPAALRDLEAIVHPAVRPRILAAMHAADEAGAPAVVIEAIKLVESGLAALCDETWLIECSAAAQRERLRGRGTPGLDARRRIASQASQWDVGTRGPLHVISTDGPVGRVRAAVEAQYADLLGRLRPD